MLANGDVKTTVETAEGNVTTYLDRTDSAGAFDSTITGAAAGTEVIYARSADGLTIDKQFPCGMAMNFKHDIDPEHGFKYLKEKTETTPLGLKTEITSTRTYEDTNADDVKDKIMRTATINGKTNTSVHDVLASQNTITLPLGRTVTATYDSGTLLTTNVNIPGLIDTEYSYDSKGRTTLIKRNTRETSFTYDTAGNVQSIKDPLNNTTTFDYDGVGRTTAIHRLTDATDIFFEYDANGNMTVLTNPAGNINSFGFNKVNLNTSWQTPLTDWVIEVI